MGRADGQVNSQSATPARAAPIVSSRRTVSGDRRFTRRTAQPLLFITALLAPNLAAQTTKPPVPPVVSPCAKETGATKRVCSAGLDALTVMVPVGGLLASGGNPRLGTAGGVKGFGDISLTLRGTYAYAVLPSAAYDGISDTVGLAKKLYAPVPAIDFSFGILRKVMPNMGSISAEILGSIIGIPRNSTQYIRFGEDNRSVGGLVLGFGYGIRLALEPTEPMPSVSLNITRHGLPKFTFGNITGGETYAYTLGVSSVGGRLLVGKKFGGFELTGGVGADMLKGEYSLRYVNPATRVLAPSIDSTKSTMRIVTLTNAAFQLGKVASLSFEGGFQVGKDEGLTTIFRATNTGAGKFFGSIGIGFKL